MIKNYLIYFLTGGIVTVIIVSLEESGWRLLSGLATIMPIFTLVAYIFIGESRGGTAVSQHALLVLIGTIISWVPYMLTIAYLSPKVGPAKSIIAGLVVFFILAIIYLTIVDRYKIFGQV